MKLGILFLFLLAAAWAETPRAVDLKGSIGYTGFADESLIGHLQTGASARIYLTRRFSLEPEFQYLRQSSNHSDVVIVPNANWDFREGRVVPYVTGGVGWVRSYFRQFRPIFTVNEAFFQVGGGVKLYVTDRWYVAPEARVGGELHFRGSVAIGYTFRR
jgi:hypothetical protein